MLLTKESILRDSKLGSVVELQKWLQSLFEARGLEAVLFQRGVMASAPLIEILFRPVPPAQQELEHLLVDVTEDVSLDLRGANLSALDVPAAEELGQVLMLLLGKLKLRQEIRNQDRIRNEFIANLSHELRTPVASILGYSHLLLDHDVDNLTERQRHFLSVLTRNTERLSCLVDHLVDLSEASQEDPTLKLEPLDLHEVYREVRPRLEIQIRAQRLNLHEDLGNESFIVLGDRQRLRQVFFTLLSNAVLFNREGGLVEVELERCPANMIAFRVSNHGQSFSPDKLRELLDRFYKIDHSGLPLELDANLGLSIAYKHIRAQHGNLVLQSNEGEGTRVTVTLPASSSVGG